MKTKKYTNLQGQESHVVINNNGTVTKTPKNKKNAISWLLKQIEARKIIDKLLQIKQPNKYFIPRILDLDIETASVIEERAPGKPLTYDFIKTLSKDDLKVIYEGIANMLYDMHNLYPMQKKDIIFETDLSFEQFISDLKNIYGFSEQEILNIKTAKNYFMDNYYPCSGNKVFSHSDLNANNIFYDKDIKIISFIDFAESKWTDLESELEKLRKNCLDIEKIRKIYNCFSSESIKSTSQNTVDVFHDLVAIKCAVKAGNSEKIRKLYNSLKTKNIFESEKNIKNNQINISESLILSHQKELSL